MSANPCDPQAKHNFRFLCLSPLFVPLSMRRMDFPPRLGAQVRTKTRSFAVHLKRSHFSSGGRHGEPVGRLVLSFQQLLEFFLQGHVQSHPVGVRSNSSTISTSVEGITDPFAPLTISTTSERISHDSPPAPPTHSRYLGNTKHGDMAGLASYCLQIETRYGQQPPQCYGGGRSGTLC